MISPHFIHEGVVTGRSWQLTKPGFGFGLSDLVLLTAKHDRNMPHCLLMSCHWAAVLGRSYEIILFLTECKASFTKSFTVSLSLTAHLPMGTKIEYLRGQGGSSFEGRWAVQGLREWASESGVHGFESWLYRLLSDLCSLWLYDGDNLALM